MLKHQVIGIRNIQLLLFKWEDTYQLKFMFMKNEPVV